MDTLDFSRVIPLPSLRTHPIIPFSNGEISANHDISVTWSTSTHSPSLCKFLQKSCLNITEKLQYLKAKINTLRSQYLGHPVYWSDKVKHLLSSIISDVNTVPIINSLNVCVITWTSNFLLRSYENGNL
jgi:hypothetical protein